MKINVYCYKCNSNLEVVEEYAEGYPFSGVTVKVEPCFDCSKENDIEPDYIEFLNNEVGWHEENIAEEITEKHKAFIDGIRHAIFLIVKAKRELTSRAADG